ncbi:ParB N-terminal domain-containing protein [Thermoflexus sp.]|uniref:ParB N-terminal domain-containing protein n=1 Tax=Thermoflexus sp. TaxID=1969742 RepID=UPI0035E44A8C
MPVLRFVPVEDLIPHEQADQVRTAPLVHRLQTEGILKNPPVVAPIPGDPRYVVLDGANRVEAARRLRLPHLVVQVVDYEDPRLRVEAWTHVISGESPESFFTTLHKIEGITLEPSEYLHARAELARRQALAYLICPRGDIYLVRAEGDLYRRTDLLNRLVDIYKSRFRFYRTTTDQLEQILPDYEQVIAVVVFPRYEPAEIIELARNGARLPAGITRHIIPYRALRINIPLEILAAPLSLEEKNAWLMEWLRRKLAAREIRVYEESVVIFDE